ncbi:MAG: response regulator, partial [Gammaproteobacteria bacterium]|nr:response regulator [Gammaproteobacteria bacterium]
MTDEAKTVLYIEDDVANRVLVRKILRAAGYEVLLAEDGIRGIDLARETHPALILMDMNIPGMDGYETSTRIKAIRGLQDVPIVALTANVLNGSCERSLIAGCDGYILKPINPDSFVEELELYLRGHREHLSSSDELPLLKEYSDKLVIRLEQKVRELTEALQQVEEANRTKTEFLAMMSHELRTPLSSIINYPEILLSECDDVLNDDHKQWLAAIRDNGKLLLEIISNVLDFISMERAPSQVSIVPVVLQELLQIALQP